MVKEIDSHGLQSRMSSGDGVHVLDIRTEAEVAAGALPRAHHLPMHLIPLRMHEFPRDKELVLYCRSGARSHHACAFLRRQGFENVINLRGGILDWARSGYAIHSALAG